MRFGHCAVANADLRIVLRDSSVSEWKLRGPTNVSVDASLVIGVAGIFINASTTQDLCIAHPLSMSCDYPLEVFHEGLPEIPNGAPPTSPHSLIVAAASAAAATSVIVKSGNR